MESEKKKHHLGRPISGWRLQLHKIIFEADTFLGKCFDIVLLLLILFSITIVMLESVNVFDNKFHQMIKTAEWVVTILFTFEYIFRLCAIKKKLKYIFSFYGLVDLLSIIPTYLSLFVTGTQSLMIIRVFRLIRVFRVLKLVRYLGEASILWEAIKSSFPKVTVFLVVVISMSLISGTLMYLIEGEQNGFSSIPRSWYWAIVTMTTVGYGDITPHTTLGQFVSSIIMLAGYGILAVPTGIVSAELAFRRSKSISVRACASCSAEGHEPSAKYCYECGEPLD
jgi:voltage-gated potassium channel